MPKRKRRVQATPPIKQQSGGAFLNRIYVGVAALIILSMVLSLVLVSLGGDGGGGDSAQP